MESKYANKLETVEAARGLAALAVVFFHSNASSVRLGQPGLELLSLGEHGVDFFFVLSGFIIFFVHRNDIGRPEQAREYLLKRLIRLFPLLWCVVLGWTAIKTAMGEGPSPASLGTSLLLYPSTADPFPLVVWTLRHEAMFYLAFLVLVWNRVAGLCLCAVWAIAVLVQVGLSITAAPVQGLPAFFLSAYQLDFMAGALVAMTARPKPSFLPLVLSSMFLVSVLAVEVHFGIGRTGLTDYISPAAIQWTPVLGLAFAAILYGLLAIEDRVRVPRALKLLGAASYSIYLVHTPMNAILQNLMGRFQISTPGLSHAIFVVAGVGAGVVLHLLFEKPVAQTLRQKLLRRAKVPEKDIAPAAAAP